MRDGNVTAGHCTHIPPAGSAIGYTRFWHHLSHSDPALPPSSPWQELGQGRVPFLSMEAHKHIPEMLVHTVTHQHAAKADEEGLDAAAQTATAPALPGERDGAPLGHPSPPQGATNGWAQVGVWVDSAKERGRRRPQAFKNCSEHSCGMQGPLCCPFLLFINYYLLIVDCFTLSSSFS